MKLTNQSTLNSKITLPDTTVEEITTLSNESNTEYMTDSFTKVKASNKTVAKPEEEIEQTITLTNNSEYDITNVSIKDTLSEGATFNSGSVIINETPYKDFDPISGFSLPNDIAASGAVIIKYTITIDSDIEASEVTNTAEITYSVNEISDLKENTNTVTIQIANNNISLVKTSNKSAVIKGDTLTYQIVITNEGNMTNTDLVFTDPLPSGVTFVEGSVKVDDIAVEDANPSTGFSLNDLEPNASTTITFDVTVN